MTAEPARPLGPEGRRLWAEWSSRLSEHDELLVACELADERQILRVRVLRDALPVDRAALRDVDERLAKQLSDIRRAASWRAYGRRRA